MKKLISVVIIGLSFISFNSAQAEDINLIEGTSAYTTLVSYSPFLSTVIDDIINKEVAYQNLDAIAFYNLSDGNIISPNLKNQIDIIMSEADLTLEQTINLIQEVSITKINN